MHGFYFENQPDSGHRLNRKFQYLPGILPLHVSQSFVLLKHKKLGGRRVTVIKKELEFGVALKSYVMFLCSKDVATV